jgi:polyisoprenoid-binding protein YceI
MKLRILSTFIFCGLLIIVMIGIHLTGCKGTASANAQTLQSVKKPGDLTDEMIALGETENGARTFAAARYRLDASQSQFMVRTFSGGLLFFKGHDHFIKVRDFTGEAELTPGAVSPASLQIRIRAESLEETRDIFTPQQKQIINKEIREIVLETAKYPEITFKSTDVAGKLNGSQFEARIGGDLTLHGGTRHIVIPTLVTLSGNDLRARGEFTITRGDFGVKATSAAKGTIRVRDRLKFTFDIVAHQI